MALKKIEFRRFYRISGSGEPAYPGSSSSNGGGCADKPNENPAYRDFMVKLKKNY